jgi:hypothetical protein
MAQRLRCYRGSISALNVGLPLSGDSLNSSGLIGAVFNLLIYALFSNLTMSTKWLALSVRLHPICMISLS